MLAPNQIYLSSKFLARAGTADNKYRTSESFVQLYRALAWTQGFDLFSQGDQRRTNLLTPPAEAGKADYFLVSTKNFHPAHNHSAPFLPLSLASENQRRASLFADDPSLHSPPLYAKGEFSLFLASLNPELLEYLPLLETIGISPTTSVQELYNIGEKDLREAMQDAGMPIFVKYEIAAGVVRAGKRKDDGEKEWDGRPARGSQAAKLRRWVDEAFVKGGDAMQANAGGSSY